MEYEEEYDPIHETPATSMNDQPSRGFGVGQTQAVAKNPAPVGQTQAVAKNPDPVVRSCRGSIVGHAADPANALTLAGLFCAVLAIYFAVRGVFSAAVIALLWATFCDWFDGPIARRTKGRAVHLQALGRQLDSLVDIVSSGVGPAILLLSIGEFSPWFIPGAFAIVVAGVLRLSHFNVFGLKDESAYLGLPIDHNVILLALVFLLEGNMARADFAILLYTVIVLLAVLNVMPFQMPKVGGRWYGVFVVYVVSLTAVYGWRLLPDMP